jgi:hypothetical protein
MPYRPCRSDMGLLPLLLMTLWINAMPVPLIPHGMPLA